MSTLITGAAGFVGAALAETLHARGVTVVSMVRDRTRQPAGVVAYGDVTDGDFCRRVLADYNVQEVYHLAAQSIVSMCAEDPLTALYIATMGTARLLQAVRDAGRAIRVVVSTSDKVYGAAPSPYVESTPLDARHSYEVSKACQDLVARMFANNYGVDVRVVRAVNIYGPNDPNESRLIPQTVRRVLSGDRPLVHAGAAQMARQWVYIDDLVSALLTVARAGAPGEVYCVGAPDGPVSVAEVIRAISACAGVSDVECEVRVRDARFCEIQEQWVRDDKLRALGWSPRVSLQEGVRRTVEWYRASQRAA
jgi:CDP-glucose 4,6-dehydratase